jgi:hypothetical protein
VSQICWSAAEPPTRLLLAADPDLLAIGADADPPIPVCAEQGVAGKFNQQRELPLQRKISLFESQQDHPRLPIFDLAG